MLMSPRGVAIFKLNALNRWPSFSSDFVDTSRSGDIPFFDAASCNAATFFFFWIGANPGFQ